MSVLVPTYNGERFLDEALRQISAQTYPHLEVLIRDDGSSDSTRKVAAHYVNSDRRFIWITGESRLGSTGNMMALLERSRGEFIKVCNQDDVLEPDCIETLLAPMIADASMMLSTSSRLLIDANSSLLEGRGYTVPLCNSSTGIFGPTLARHVLVTCGNQIGEPSTVLFRRGVFPVCETFTLNGITYQVNNDIALWLKLLAVGNAYFCLRPLSRFRLHSEQRSADATEGVTGTLEWPHLLEWGIRRGYVQPGADTEAARRNILDHFCWARDLAAAASDGQLPLHLKRLDEGLVRLTRLMDNAKLLVGQAA